MSLEISGYTAQVNGAVIPLAKKPKFKRGAPKIDTHVSMVGSKKVNTQSRDYSEAYSTVVIAVRNLPENIEACEGWQDNVGKNAIRILDEDTGFIRTFNECSVAEDVEWDFDAEEVEIEFHGNEAI